ncbi:MAG: hypothetical protein EOO68_26505 [Moraxellaceae bacterium]|nr:MAG: hypothetical protein EOO68_26505 [Moraxellaceae bacterium]
MASVDDKILKSEIELYVLNSKAYSNSVEISKKFGFDLNNRDFKGIYLKDTILSDIDFSNTTLDLANISNGYCIKTNLSRSSLKAIMKVL